LVKSQRVSIPIMQYDSNAGYYYWSGNSGKSLVADDFSINRPVHEVLVKLIFVGDDNSEQYYCEPTMWVLPRATTPSTVPSVLGGEVNFARRCEEWEQSLK